MTFSSKKFLQLLKLYFPDFSSVNFCKVSKLEQAQWLYKLVYQARFEFVSHFLFGPYSNYIKNGEEFLEGLFYGQGGVCLERVMALRLLMESFDIGECRYVMGGSLPGVNQPIDVEAVRNNLLDKENQSISPYAHHAALVVEIMGGEWLMDPNGGRLGEVFLNPSLTQRVLTEDVENKLGVLASFGQMFYTRAPEELFWLTVARRRGTLPEQLDLICLIGLLVGPNYDVFLIPKNELRTRIMRLYPHRVQTMCWEIKGNLLEGLSQHGLCIEKAPGEDLFLQKIDSAPALLNNLSSVELQPVLRIAAKPWSQFTEVSRAIPQELMMC